MGAVKRNAYVCMLTSEQIYIYFKIYMNLSLSLSLSLSLQYESVSLFESVLIPLTNLVYLSESEQCLIIFHIL